MENTLFRRQTGLALRLVSCARTFCTFELFLLAVPARDGRKIILSYKKVLSARRPANHKFVAEY